ncbi:hypothetical protein HYDPIDRAFT_33339 [Hydnomerulius pinastri MD-312]|uniref:GH3 middle domain-containing protein n=1 Tax=Hydnomerulius pinastri MD-312 TaxID=994086 RepID=A0A0C9V216_9AGAM|nr:hypothetical protein HYDPIDRAFT_33339 [Hydnomerulius pinastri MD-312]
MSQVPNFSVPCISLSPELQKTSVERTERLLLRILRANAHTQYASQASTLADFRHAISKHGLDDDASLLNDFRTFVPLTGYESYKPLIAKFDERPYKESELQDLFAPGLPHFLAVSSTTSGKAPKIFARYRHVPQEFSQLHRHGLNYRWVDGPTSWIYYYGYRDLKEVEGEPGHVIKRIPVCQVSGGSLRTYFDWNVEDDESRLASTIPGHAEPWAATMITNHRSFLMIHALFCLATRDLKRIAITFATLFADMMRRVDEEWDMLLDCIRNGTIPHLDSLDDLRVYLEPQLRANPERADELREIGPPSSCDGWAARVWPDFEMILTICSGGFATALPKVRSILGPAVNIINPGYGSTECNIAANFDPTDLDSLVITTEDVIEFMDVTVEESERCILQAWELQVGKLYEIVLTTRDGLWRYALGDIVEITGFASDDGSPVFKFSGRKSLAIRFPCTVITDAHLTATIQAINSQDLIQVHEFTTVVDDRELPETVGYFVEVAGPLGSDSHLAPQRLFDSLVATNSEHQAALGRGETRLPTVRIVKPGTFMDYRRWRGETMNIGSGQIKVPVVLTDPATQEWMLGRVIREL